MSRKRNPGTEPDYFAPEESEVVLTDAPALKPQVEVAAPEAEPEPPPSAPLITLEAFIRTKAELGRAFRATVLASCGKRVPKKTAAAWQADYDSWLVKAR